MTIAGEGSADLGFGNPLEPRHLVWARVGEDGPIFSMRSNHYSFTASQHGELYLAPSPPALVWATRTGDWIGPFAESPDVPMNLVLNAYRWRDDARAGLEALAQQASKDGRAEAALRAMEEARELPAGYDYLWFLSASNVFGAYQADGRKGVHVETDDDFGIIRRPLDIPLTAETRFEFDWLYEALPAVAAENDAGSHDYMSIALEFDNGQDITWFWSVSLPEGESFPCPLPDWQHRETHIVLQSGDEGLGEWHRHSRPVLADYEASVGGEPPRKIVAAWVIGASVFNRRPAEAYFADAAVVDGDRRVDVFD